MSCRDPLDKSFFHSPKKIIFLSLFVIIAMTPVVYLFFSKYRFRFSLNTSRASSDKNQSADSELVGINEKFPNLASKYADGQLIIKIKDGSDITETKETVNGEKVTKFKGPDSLEKLHKKYSLKKIERIINNEYTSADENGNSVSLDFKQKAEQIKNKYPKRAKRTPKDSKIKDLSNIFLLKFDKDTPIEDLINDYKKDKNIEYVEPNWIFTPDDTAPNDPKFGNQYSHQKTQAAKAWDIRHDASDIVVAIIGQGIDYNHPDLAANIWSNPYEIPGNGIDDDGNGYIDDIKGWDFYSNDNNPAPENGEVHETEVAGVIGSVGNNAVGVSGISWKVKMMPLRMNYTTENIITALTYAYENGADVVNMSFGHYGYDQYWDAAIQDLVNLCASGGMVVVATAGNDSTDNKRYPGALENLIGVASTDSSDVRSVFSNWGSWVDVAAPGSSILTTSPGSSYTTASGTSFAAPYVAGLAALVMAQNPDFDSTTIRNVIEYTADKIQTDLPIGSGRINAFKALQATGTPDLFALIKYPVTNSMVDPFQPLKITGTALGIRYNVKYKSVSETTWRDLASHNISVIDGELATLNLDNLTDGTYEV